VYSGIAVERLEFRSEFSETISATSARRRT
jgi:hypothetical protein